MRVAIAASVVLLLSVTCTEGGGTGKPSKEDVPKYLKMLKATSAKDRATAAEMLGKLGAIRASDVKEGVEPLKKLLKDDSENSVKAAAAAALGNISPDAETTVPLLIDALKEKSGDVKIAAMRALGQYAAMAKDAVQPLREIQKEFKEKDKKLAQEAGMALKAIAGKKK